MIFITLFFKLVLNSYKRNRYVFNYNYVLKKYHRIKTIKSYGVWKNKDQPE